MKLKKKDQSLFLGLILLFSTVGFAVLSGIQNQGLGNDAPTNNNQNNQLLFVDNWKNIPLYEQKLVGNQSIYYLQLAQGYNLPLRADPREAEKIESPLGVTIYSKIYGSKKVYALFDPDYVGNVSLAFTELSRFLNNRPFEVVYGTIKPYIDDNNETYPYKDPYNTTKDEAVVFMTISDYTGIILKNNTVVVSGSDMRSLVTATSKLQLMLLRLI